MNVFSNQQENIILSVSVYLALAHHSSDFSSAHYVLLYAMGGKGDIHRSNYILCGMICVTVILAHCAYNGEMLLWTVILSRVCIEQVQSVSY
jgi:hypothetical protein